MVLWDDRILEILQLDGFQSCGMIEKYNEIHVGSAHISNRLKKLAEHGLTEPIGRGMYDITDEGILYLEGYYDANTGETVDHENDGHLSELIEKYNKNHPNEKSNK